MNTKAIVFASLFFSSMFLVQETYSHMTNPYEHDAVIANCQAKPSYESDHDEYEDPRYPESVAIGIAAGILQAWLNKGVPYGSNHMTVSVHGDPTYDLSFSNVSNEYMIIWSLCTLLHSSGVSALHYDGSGRVHPAQPTAHALALASATISWIVARQFFNASVR